MLLASIPVKAQYVQPVFEDTVSNSMAKTFYVYLDQFKKQPGEKIDSVTFVIYGVGELDVDRLIITGGVDITNPAFNFTAFYAAAAGDTTTLTINLDSAVTTLVAALTKTYANLDGMNILKCVIDAASSGNDAADPNYLSVVIIVWTSKT